MPKQAGRDPEQLPEHGGTRAIHRFAYQPASDKTDALQEFFRLTGL
jgi:hypothetical protein